MAGGSIGLKYAPIAIVLGLDVIVDLEARLCEVVAVGVHAKQRSLWWERLT